jgi:hypothetical protein
MAGLIKQAMEQSPADMAADSAEAKQMGMSPEAYEQSPQDMRADAGAGSAQETMDQVAAMDDTPDINQDTDPAYQAALNAAHQVLYKNGAAEDIAMSLKTAPDLTEALANTAYDIVTALDDKTEGAVPDELIASLALEILTEVADIGDAAGVGVTSAIVGEAVKQMMLRYVTENGGDSSALQQSFGGIDTNKIGAVLDAPKAA